MAITLLREVRGDGRALASAPSRIAEGELEELGDERFASVKRQVLTTGRAA